MQIENERQADAEAVDTEAVDLDSFSWNYEEGVGEESHSWQGAEPSNRDNREAGEEEGATGRTS